MRLEYIVLIFWAAYLIGSIPVAFGIARLHGIDIFTVGSGNMGATNVIRAVGMRWGALTWALDCAKGILAIYVARQIAPDDHLGKATMIGAIGVVVGHNWSIGAMILTGKLRGGKGAAAALGTWLVFLPAWLLAAAFLVWLAIVIATRFVSLAVLTTTMLVSLAIAVMVVVGDYEPVYISYWIVTALIFYRHRDNIRALIEGRERRFGTPAE